MAHRKLSELNDRELLFQILIRLEKLEILMAASKQDLLNAQADTLKAAGDVATSATNAAARVAALPPEDQTDAVANEQAIQGQLATAKQAIDAIAPAAPPA